MQMLPASLALVLLSSSASAAPDLVTLYKTYPGGKCSQVGIDRALKARVIAYGLKEGNCGSHGYTIPAGTRVINVPALGEITGQFFQHQPTEVLDGVTMHRIDDGRCGQISVSKNQVSFAATHDGLKEGACKSQGYTVPAGVETVELPSLGEITARFFFKKSPEKAVEGVTLHRIVDGECSKTDECECTQTTIRKQLKAVAIEEAGLGQEGDCATLDYIIPDGTRTMNVPVLGQITGHVFKKDLLTMYKVIDKDTQQERCLQTKIAKISSQAPAAVRDSFWSDVASAGLHGGSCASTGYPIPSALWGRMGILIPALGKIYGPIFEKEAHKVVHV